MKKSSRPVLATSPTGSRQQQLFRSALILQKTTRWQWEKETTETTGAKLKKCLQSKETNVQKTLENERKQAEKIAEIVAKLEGVGISARVVNPEQLRQFLPEADLVISTGGEETFLVAASVVTDGTPVIDLCGGGKNHLKDFIDQIASGELKWITRSRIRVTVKDPVIKTSISPLNNESKVAFTHLVLNEVFIGEDEAAKVSTYYISIDDSPMVKQKSSGLIVSTGTGSTRWFLGTNRTDESTVSSIMDTMQGLGVDVPLNESTVEQVTRAFNHKIVFEPDHPNFAFSVREPVFNATFKRTATHGYAQKIELESRCSNGYLVLDKFNKIPFPRGAVATLEIIMTDALKTVIL